jgi:molybdate transport system substrate-binding protein
MRAPTRVALTVVMIALAAATTGCPSGQRADELEILCGTSFRPPMEKVLARYEQETGGRAVLSFGGSEDLLPHVKAHARGDVFVTHDPYVQYTEENDAMLRWVQVGCLSPVIVVPKGNPDKIERLEDLAKPGLRVAVTNPEYSTCGEMLYEMLENTQVEDAILQNVGNAQFRSHSEVANKVKLGACDAGVMWNGVAHNFLDALDVIPISYEGEAVRVGVIGLSYSKKPDKVEAFLKFVDENGKQVFEEFGYVK